MTDSIYEEKLRVWLRDNAVRAEHLSFNQSCHSVAEAAEAAGVTPEDFIKSICLMAEDGSLIVAVVKGEDRAGMKLVGRALGIATPRLATPDEMLTLSGYPCGGTPPFGFAARFVMDERVFEKEVIYGGGGSATSLVQIAPAEMARVNGGVTAKIRK